MDFYQKIDFANPTDLMLEQILLDLMYQTQHIIAQSNNEATEVDLKYAFTLDGKPIKSILDLHQ